MKKICFVLTFFVVSLSLLTTPLYAEVTYSLNAGTLTFTYSGSGSSEMKDYEDPDGSAASSEKRPATWVYNVTNVIINEGVTTIGTYAFYGLSNLKTVHIPISLTRFKANAFQSCGSLTTIYYAGTPNEWANIDFEVEGTFPYCHPFFNNTSTKNDFYFYGQTTKRTEVIIFQEGLQVIKPYTFYKSNITDVCIPSSVTNIGQKAFNSCTNLARITILNTSAPTASTDAFEGMSSSGTLFVPSGANGSTSSPGFKRLPWYDSSSSNKGPKYIGYNNTDNSYTTTGNNFGTGKVYPLNGKVNNVDWTLSLDGTLTLEGEGTLPSTFVGATWTSDNLLPWARFRRMVNKVIVKAKGGDITNLGNIIQYCYAIETISIQQNTIPSGTYTVMNDFKKSTDKVILSVNPVASIINSAKSSAPWNAERIQLSINESVDLDEATDNTGILTAIKNNITPPFTANLSRSLKSVSFNSFCSPVPMTAEQVQSVFGAGTEIYTLESSNYNESENTLYINLSENQTTIEAGKPYIIKPANNEPTITIDNVNPEDIATAGQTISTDAIDFHGLLNPYTLVSGDKFLVVSANNELNWTESGTMKGMRSYFTLKSGIPARALSARASFVFPNNSPEAVNNVSNAQQPIQKVMRNGQLVIIRDGVTYNTMGQVIE